MSAPAPASPLEYASRDTQPPQWGPILFRPSRLTLILTLLTAAAAMWLAMRHHPWRRLATFATAEETVTFTRDGLVLVSPGTPEVQPLVNTPWAPRWSAPVGAEFFDPATGRLVRRTPLDFDPRHAQRMVLAGGDQFLWWPLNNSTGTLVDLRSGARRELRLPGPPRTFTGPAVQPPRVITSSNRSATSLSEVHPLPPDPATQPVHLGVPGWRIDFSPDGGRILSVDPNRGKSGETLTLLDAHTGQIIGQPFDAAGAGDPGLAFVSPSWILIPGERWGPNQTQVDLYSAQTGTRVHSLNVPLGRDDRGRQLAEGRLAVSDDGTLLAQLARAPGTGFGPLRHVLEVYDTTSGARRMSRPVRHSGKMTFLPHSHRLLARLPEEGDALAIIDPDHHQPLAILPPPPPTPGTTGSPVITAHVRPDGQMIVAHESFPTRRVTTYGKTGFDCPESRSGALAFPQTWITAVLFLAWVFSALRDARLARGPADAHHLPTPVTAGLPAIAAPLTLLALLAACLGRPTLSPAPLLLLAAIGLATHSRFWHLATLVLLAGTLAGCAYLLLRLRRAGLTGDPVQWAPLDRTYAIPHVLPTAALGLATLLAALAIVLLTLRPRRAV